jgi:hypothetical protein
MNRQMFSQNTTLGECQHCCTSVNCDHTSHLPKVPLQPPDSLRHALIRLERHSSNASSVPSITSPSLSPLTVPSEIPSNPGSPVPPVVSPEIPSVPVLSVPSNPVAAPFEVPLDLATPPEVWFAPTPPAVCPSSVAAPSEVPLYLATPPEVWCAPTPPAVCPTVVPLEAPLPHALPSEAPCRCTVPSEAPSTPKIVPSETPPGAPSSVPSKARHILHAVSRAPQAQSRTAPPRCGAPSYVPMAMPSGAPNSVLSEVRLPRQSPFEVTVFHAGAALRSCAPSFIPMVMPFAKVPVHKCAPSRDSMVMPSVKIPVQNCAPSSAPPVPPKLPIETLNTKFRPLPIRTALLRPLSPTSVCWEPPAVRQKPPAREPDELDRLVQEAAELYNTSDSWDDFVPKVRDSRGDFHQHVGKIAHPAAHLLNRFRLGGAPVTCKGTPWTFAQKAAALFRGPHQSANLHIPFLRQEFVDMIRKGQWTLLPARLVLDELQLRLSPLGVVPQRDRRPRTISDYTFFGINHETVALSPSECMQFGKALWRILRHVKSANPHLGPVYMSKIDIADGFYRIWVRARDVPKLGVLFPSDDGEEYLIGFPLALPMGWTESPKIFTAATETVADLTNSNLQAAVPFGPHRLDAVSESPVPDVPPATSSESPVPDVTRAPSPQPPLLRRSERPAPLPKGPRPSTASHYKRPIALWDVYVDDFLGLVQGGTRTRRRVKRALLHTLDTVLRPLDGHDSPFRQEPASTKKMAKGDATWSTVKTILGWIINTLDKTISLPEHRLLRLRAILSSIATTQRRVSLKKWQQVLGELRSMALAIPAAIGLFSVLQEALKSSDGKRVRLTTHTQAFLHDFRWLVEDVGSRPTEIAEIVPDAIPATKGACDASGLGLGGVHFVPLPDGRTLPMLWRQKWPASVPARLVSSSNPTGDVTNSELELAATIAQFDVLAQAVDIRSHTIHNLSDNSATVAWQRKGAASTSGPVAYLLRLHALHQRHHRYIPLHDFIAGVSNVLADQCSRLFNLTDQQLLSHFDLAFPQTMPWQQFHLRAETLSALISALSKKRPDLASLLNAPKQRMRIGTVGSSSAWNTTSTPLYATAPTPSPSSKSSPNATATDETPPKESPLNLERWRTPSVRWARRSPNWGPRTSARMPSAK